MTSDTQPSGEFSCSSKKLGSEYAYKAFDKFIDSTHGYGWANNGNDNNPWIQYDFSYKVFIKLLHLQSVVISAENDNEIKDFYVSASKDGVNFVKLTDTLTFAENTNVAYNKKFVN